MKCTSPWFRLVQNDFSLRLLNRQALLRLPADCTLPAIDFSKDPLMISVDIYERLCRYIPAVRELDFMQVPCGKCAACQQTRAQEWTDRLMMELPYTFGGSSFITMTYNDSSVPLSYTVSPWTGRQEYCHPIRVADFQGFMKRLRNDFPGVRFLASAEYGGRFHRPHFHAAIVGFRPDDLKFYKMENGRVYYKSAYVEEKWKAGFCVISDLTPDSAAYVARYMTQKWESRDWKLYAAETASRGLEPLPPQKLIMSRRPGLGRQYLEDHRDQISADSLVVPATGRSVPAFRYALGVAGEDLSDDLKARRSERAPRDLNTDLSLTDLGNKEAARLLRQKKQRNSF